MNRKILLTVLTLAVVLLGTTYTVFAETVYTEHDYAVANCVIDVPGRTMIRLIAYGQMYGDYFPGRAERIQITVHTGQFSGGLPVFKSVTAYEDNPIRSDFSKYQIALGLSENLVEPGQIQVLRVGKSNAVMAHWTVPLVCPATSTTPAVTLPPGKLVLEGDDEAHSFTTSSTSIGPNNWKYSAVGTYNHAKATLFCVSWDYKWLPVAEQFVGTSMEPRVSEQSWTWTHP